MELRKGWPLTVPRTGTRARVPKTFSASKGTVKRAASEPRKPRASGAETLLRRHDISPQPRARERQRESLKAAEVPLFITESAIESRCWIEHWLAHSRHSWRDGWRAKNIYDGVTTHPAWEEINLKRHVYFAHDSDSLENKRVRRAIKRHRNWLAYKGATVKYIWLPPKADGSKCGLDDFIGERKARGLTDDEIRAELLKYAADEIPNDDNPDSAEPTFNATDMGNAERFIQSA